jgi:hypothetical protein
MYPAKGLAKAISQKNGVRGPRYYYFGYFPEDESLPY